MSVLTFVTRHFVSYNYFQQVENRFGVLMVTVCFIELVMQIIVVDLLQIPEDVFYNCAGMGYWEYSRTC